MGRINVNIYNQDEYHDSQPCQQSSKSSVPSVHHDVIWIPIAIFLSIFLTVGWGANSRYPGGGGGSSPVIINNR